ncbi:hypothetical protein GQ43DRAFT_447877 [Delitschia confertaspora ATCC 74209]|uniref:LIM zinc-binding domain-containing protein n=1 Tax=Delitschia confertaspora ATCC 74209 TaxID=1513339 RepID=A0A9P4JQZ0_9PLEO|nr:hypothetical protein GQ43DRAFT_447877 [Delitschia confertaspora ATCC 74209]
MTSTERPLSILPSIKCSSCGVDIEIAELADHVCAPASSKNVEPVMAKLDRAATFSGGSTAPTSSALHPGRMPPPRIDPNAANILSQPRDMLTPMSNYSDPNTYSPISPVSGRSPSPFKLTRSVTTPMPLSLSLPSPDLPGNMDCAFPPFPTSRPSTPNVPKSRPRTKLAPIDTRHTAANSSFAPVSPRTNGGANVMNRMNTIAPGPFDGRGLENRRPSASAPDASAQKEAKEAMESRERSETKTSAYSSGNEQTQRVSVGSTRSRSSTVSKNVVGLPSRPKTGGPPPRPPRAEGIDEFLNQLQKETMGSAQTGQDSSLRIIPLRKGSEDTVVPSDSASIRRPSDAGSWFRRPSDAGPMSSAPKPSNMFRSRSSSRPSSISGFRPEEPAPPMPPPPPPTILASEKGQPPKSLHTPSDSGLSDDSTTSSSFQSTASSRSSPPASESGHSRNLSKMSRIDSPAEENIRQTATPDEMFLPELTPATPQESRISRGGYDRGNAPAPLLPASRLRVDAPESPMDPAIHRGLLHQQRPSTAQDARKGSVPELLPRPNTSQDTRKASTPDLSASPPKQAPTADSRPPMKGRPTAGPKGNCRGCSEPIIGKSIKAADGRLTGRYHKQCFVCQTCRAPFQTADFYVFENNPYCEQHYHQLNGSLCKACGRGIEGAYLETDRKAKFHPRCFSCMTCRIILRDDYFEVGGKPFCERHAYHANAQQNSFLGPAGPGRQRFPERRTTRLMMMA